MRSYHKVYANNSQNAISLTPVTGFQPKPFYIQVVLHSKAKDFVDGYNYLGSCAFAAGNTPHWTAFNTDGTINITFSGQQLANLIFPLRSYSLHPLN